MRSEESNNSNTFQRRPRTCSKGCCLEQTTTTTTKVTRRTCVKEDVFYLYLDSAMIVDVVVSVITRTNSHVDEKLHVCTSKYLVASFR